MTLTKSNPKRVKILVAILIAECLAFALMEFMLI